MHVIRIPQEFCLYQIDGLSGGIPWRCNSTEQKHFIEWKLGHTPTDEPELNEQDNLTQLMYLHSIGQINMSP